VICARKPRPQTNWNGIVFWVVFPGFVRLSPHVEPAVTDGSI
jgi:hypothetical protein